MDTQAALKRNYHAALAMLIQAIERCPDEVWTSGVPPRQFWRIAYHAVFYTHFYLQPGVEGFVPWAGHREEWSDLYDGPECEPCSRAALLEFAAFVDGEIDRVVDRLDLDAPTCGFPWYQMPKLDHEIMNLRHSQQHAGQLSEILYAAGVDLDWIGGR